jgi:hypothetical protein
MRINYFLEIFLFFFFCFVIQKRQICEIKHIVNLAAVEANSEITEMELKQKGCYRYQERLKDFFVFGNETFACPLGLLKNHSEIRTLEMDQKQKNVYCGF